MQTTDILFDIVKGNEGNIGLIILNRPHVLNALSLEMILAMYQKLEEWRMDAQIKAVVIKGNGDRAFCAGGDIRHTYEQHQLGRSESNLYFWHEYRLNHAIHHYKKPYIALMHGITMGGGVGVALHGSHRVGADSLTLAMPETTIGFFPDVGGTYLLPRLIDKIGFYLGLTGARINANDAYSLDMVDAVIAQNQFEDVIRALADVKFASESKATVSTILADFQQPIGQSTLLSLQAKINHCFGQATIKQIISELSQEQDTWAEHCRANLLTKSPTSLCVTLAALQRGAKQSFDEGMRMEFQLACHFLRGHDFFEGIRAAVIDKDRNPKWQPGSLMEIDSAKIAQYFVPLPGKELNFD